MITETDLLKSTTREVAHYNGGKVWFGYLHRSNQYPRLARMDKYFRATRAVESTWRVDGEPVANLAEAADRLSVPYVATPEQIELLKDVPDEFTLLEERARFTPLVEFGLVEFRDGKCRRTDTGRTTITNQESV